MTLAGIWRARDEPLTLLIDGQDPSYQFRFEGVAGGFSGVLSQGFVQRLPDGAYLGTGQGIGGPVRFRCWLPQADVMHWQNQAFVDGGFVDNLLGAFLPAVAATQPVGVLFRQHAVVPPDPTPPRRNEAVDPDVVARKAAEILANAATAQAQKQERESEARRKRKQVAQSDEDPMVQLNKLVGMSEVKMQIERLDAWAWRQQELKSHDKEAAAPSLHMCFSGGPGTGKTTVARIIGRLLKKYDLLAHGRLQEVGRSDLVAEFVGQTATKTEKAIDEGIGGVLFIDEAYALSEPGAGGGRGDYGAEALAVLIAGMENHRHELCVIVAGYPAEMERFIDANAGLASRISRHIKFPDFTDQELEDVFKAMANGQGLKLDPGIVQAFQPYIRRAKATAKLRQWGNARTVRNIFERGIENQSLRLRKAGKKPSRDQLFRLELGDFAFFNAPEVSIS